MIGNKSLVLFKLLIFYQNACQGFESLSLKILQYNVQAVRSPWSQYKTERMQALAQRIKDRNPYFDILTLNELWHQTDHNLIQQAAQQAGLYMTGFHELNRWRCIGSSAPVACSGLAIVSAYPFKQSYFTEFRDKGTFFGMFSGDWELYWAKGIGRVRIEPVANLTIDIFTTHTRDNYWSSGNAIRSNQIEQLNEEISTSTADVVILGGDLNTEPNTKLLSYKNLANYLTNSADERSSQGWQVPATYGNPNNYFSKNKKPQIIDYIFYRSFSNDLEVKTEKYLPLNFVVGMNKGCEHECNVNVIAPTCSKVCHPNEIPLSDHEPIMVIIQIKNITNQVGRLMYNSFQNRKRINDLQERVEDLESMAFDRLSRP